jgi:hypothetical protein
MKLTSCSLRTAGTCPSAAAARFVMNELVTMNELAASRMSANRRTCGKLCGMAGEVVLMCVRLYSERHGDESREELS